MIPSEHIHPKITKDKGTAPGVLKSEFNTLVTQSLGVCNFFYFLFLWWKLKPFIIKIIIFIFIFISSSTYWPVLLNQKRQ